MNSDYQARVDHLLATLDSIKQVDLSAVEKDKLNAARQQVLSLAEALEEVRSQAESIQQEKSKFVSVVTHELRLPLTSIKGYTDLLRQGIAGPVNEQQTSFLNIVRNNVDRMSTLISDLSDMSHIQSGRLKLQLVEGSIESLLTEAVATWEKRCAEKDQTFSVTSEPGIKPFAFDASRLKQVLNYLLNNAQRYTRAGGQIHLHVEQENGYLKLSLQDTGIGISPADQANLFTPFFRSEDNAVRELPGWGLSLYVVKLLVNLMGGEVGALSESGQGSTFWFTLPVN